MGFQEAIRTCIKEKYATFSGRASRSEYWWFVLFVSLVAIALGGIGLATMNFETGEPSTVSIIFFALVGVFYLAMLLPMIGVGVRRFHDRDLSGWWYLGAMIGGAIPYVGFVVSIAALVVTLLKGTDGDNRFGPDPLKIQNRADIFA